MECWKCGRDMLLPFKCPYCNGYFCSEHRLPESHGCQQIGLARAPRFETRLTAVEEREPYMYGVTYVAFRPSGRTHFSSKEVQHLTVATLLVIGVGISLMAFPKPLGHYVADYLTLSAFIAMFAFSFLLHEIAHKITAQKEGLWAEFRLTAVGAILTSLSIILPFKLVSPGAVVVAGFADRVSVGRISIAGPLTNIVLSSAFLAAATSIQQHPLTFALGAIFNAWIALFNLIPFGVLDGFKVFTWNKAVWALTFATSLALTVTSHRLI